MNSAQKRSFFTKTIHGERGHSSKLLKMEDSFGFIPVFTTKFQLHCILTHTTKLQNSGFINQDYKKNQEKSMMPVLYNTMYCLQLFCLNLVIQNGNKNTGAACLKNSLFLLIGAFFSTLVKCKTATFEAGREHTDFDTSNVYNTFYHKATFTSLPVSLIYTQNNYDLK